MIKPTKFDGQKYIAPTWEEMGEICFSLAQKISKDDPQRFNRLIALAKGGLTWSRTLVDYLKIPEIATVQICFYTDIGKTGNKPIVIQSLPVDVSGENVLLFDDVADSGKTLVVAKEYLSLCGAKKVTTATLFVKTWTQTRPNFYSAKTDSWIIFPHEIREMVELLQKKWSKEKMSRQEIIERLIKIGLPKTQVTYFLN